MLNAYGSCCALHTICCDLSASHAVKQQIGYTHALLQPHSAHAVLHVKVQKQVDGRRAAAPVLLHDTQSLDWAHQNHGGCSDGCRSDAVELTPRILCLYLRSASSVWLGAVSACLGRHLFWQVAIVG